MKNKLTLFALMVAIPATFLLSACGQTPAENNGQNTRQQAGLTGTQQLIGGQKDEGGCLIAAGYRWCKDLNKCVRPWEEFCADLAPETLAALKDSTGMKLSDPADAGIQWKVRETEGIKTMNLKGKFSAIENVTKEDYDKIGAYMLSEGFDPDLYNTSSGENGAGTAGYKKTNIGLVCVVSHTASRPTQGMTAEQISAMNRNVNVACGIKPKS
jgi:hypothetical protein